MIADTFRRDLRIGLRVLVKEKSFCALAVVVLALGICGVTTMFSVVNGVMLRGFSFPNEARLVSANFIDPSSANFFGQNGQISSMDFDELVPAQQSLELMAAYLNGSTVNMSVNGKPQRYTGAYTTENFLRILGVPPQLGRDFTVADNTPGAEKVALIGYGIWQRDFAGSSDVVGKGVRINGKPATIIGVMPKGFAFPSNEELWIPLYSEFPTKPRNDPAANNPAVLGLLKPGVSYDQANAEFTTLARHFAEAYPATNKPFNTGLVEPLIKTYTPRPLRGTLLTMLGFCVGVLLIACVNVMNMQFARATLRAKELAIRSSLGATRIRLIRQMLTESLLVAGIGAAVGVTLAYFSIDWLSATVRNLENAPPSWITFDVDGVVLAVTVTSTLAAAAVSGLLPAWMSSRANTNAVLRDGGRGSTGRRVNMISRGLVVFQIVVTCVLLIGSLLQVRSILKQQTIDYGYDTAGVMSARMGLMDGDYPSGDARKLFYDRLLRTLRNDPEFDAVALTNRFRMVFSGSSPIELDGNVYKENRDRPTTNFEQVTGGFFDVTSQRLLAGRTFTDDDLDTKRPVAIVNAAFARKHFGNESALGRRFRSMNANGTQPGVWRTIVGVVSTTRMLGPFNPPNTDETGYYVPFYSTATGPALPTPFVSQFATIVVKPHTGQRADTLASVLRREVNKADPNLPLYFVGTPKSQAAVFVAQNRIIATMFTIFGAVAVVLASVGIYGVMSFSVSQRTQEFGVRMALGANDGRILGMVLKQGVAQIAIGLTLGLGFALSIAIVAGNGIQSTLFGVSARDPLTYGVVVGLVTLVSLVATLVPARRATRVDPMIALRAE
ncbi:MAG TPA: ABC transporter permease [Vicinamibacterales bacterium]|nr:ABC transporter permease [Vicinamibacterales bacterium]